jgi:hypothetical protein
MKPLRGLWRARMYVVVFVVINLDVFEDLPARFALAEEKTRNGI